VDTIKVLLYDVRYSAVMTAVGTYFNITLSFCATGRVSILLAEVEDGRNAMSLGALR
jgi:hypothetical protein